MNDLLTELRMQGPPMSTEWDTYAAGWHAALDGVESLLAAHPAPATDEHCGNCLGISVETCMTHPAPVSDTLRTALTKFADDRDAMCRSCARDLRALLAAHPAPTEAAEALCLADTSWEHHGRTDDFPCSSCVSDTRREDVEAVACALENDLGDLLPPGSYAWERFAKNVLAVLPAPPVVDEAALSAYLDLHLVDVHEGPSASDLAALVAAHLRGATRG